MHTQPFDVSEQKSRVAKDGREGCVEQARHNCALRDNHCIVPVSQP